MPGIDAILVGHAHIEFNQLVTNSDTGKQVLLVEPLYWGMRVARMDLPLAKVQGQWAVDDTALVGTAATTPTPCPRTPRSPRSSGPRTRRSSTYVNSVIGTSKQAMSAATSRYEDTAAMDFINYVQADAVKKVLAGTPDATTPVLSIAAPFNKAAAIPAGDVTVRDVAGLYIFDNTLLGHQVHRRPGAGLPRVLGAATSSRSAAPARSPPTRSPTPSRPTAPNGTPDYNYDIMGGLDAPLTYDIDIAQPVGSRITNLQYAGAPVTGEPGVRHRHQQLPAVRRRQLPGRDDGSGASTTRRSRSGSCSSTG